MQDHEMIGRAKALISAAFGPPNADSQRATQELVDLQGKELGWDISANLMKENFESDNAEMSEAEVHQLFWSLGVLTMKIPSHLPSIKPEERDAFRKFFFAWLVKKGHLNAPLFIKKKIAHLFAVALRTEYPESWQGDGGFWHSLNKWLYNGSDQGVTKVVLYLAIQESVASEIMNLTAQGNDRATAIKDAMRVECVEQIVTAWSNLLEHYHPTAKESTEIQEIASQCLSTVQLYIEWIDINLVVTQKWLQTFHQYLMISGTRSASLSCMLELVLKRMREPEQKVNFLNSLNITVFLKAAVDPVLQAIQKEVVEEASNCAPGGSVMLGLDDAEIDDYPAQLSHLCAKTGIEYLIAIDQGEERTPGAEWLTNARAQLEVLLPLMQWLLKTPHLGVSQNAIEFFKEWLHRVKRECGVSGGPSPKVANEEAAGRRAQTLRQLSEVIWERIAIPSDYDLQTPTDDFEATFDAYRGSLDTLEKGVVQCNPAVTKAFIMDKLKDLIQGGDWSKLEAVLHMFYQLGEGAKPQSMVDENDIFYHCLMMITQSEISQHPHRAVRMAYFEVVERYSHFYCHLPAGMGENGSLEKVLLSFLDSRGCRCEDGLVAAKSAQLLSRFINVTRQKAIPFVGKLTENVVATISECNLSQEGAALSLDSQAKLFETIGALINIENIPIATTLQAFERLTKPLTTTCDLIRAAQGQAPPAEAVKHFNTHLTFGIALSKGFPLYTSPKERGEVGALKEVSHPWGIIYPSAVEAFKNSHISACPPIREKMVQFTHRMVEVLGDHISDFVAKNFILHHLQTARDLPDAGKAVRIFAQMVKKLQERSAAPLGPLLIPVSVAVFGRANVDCLGAQEGVVSEEQKESIELLKQYLDILHNAFNSNAQTLLSTPPNQERIFDLLEPLVRYSTSNPKHQIARNCVATLRRVAEAFPGEQGLQDWMDKIVLPASFSILSQPHMTNTDARCSMVLSEVANLHRKLFEQGHKERIPTLLAEAGGVDPNSLGQFKAVVEGALTGEQQGDYINCLKTVVAQRTGR